MVSNCSQRRGSKQGHVPFTIAGTLEVHYGGIEATKLTTVNIAVDLASTEQRAGILHVVQREPSEGRSRRNRATRTPRLSFAGLYAKGQRMLMSASL